MSELADLRGHLEQYRAVTLQHFDILSDEQMSWRPRDDAFTCAQQLYHIVSNEDFFIRGLCGRWEADRLRLPKPMLHKRALRAMFDDVRAQTRRYLDLLPESSLEEVRRHGLAPVDATIRAWLWFILEHEIHHKAQLSEYLRTMGLTPPYFAMALPLGERPDVQARHDLGGV